MTDSQQPRQPDTEHFPLVLCTDPKVWADEFIKAFPDIEDNVLEETGVTREDIVAWFDAAMETKRMMAIASLPLPPMH